MPVLFLLRRSLEETEAFARRDHRPDIKAILASIAGAWPTVLLGVMLATTTTVAFYLITAYTPTFGEAVLKLSSQDAFVVTFCVGASNFFWLPVMGALSEKVGRKKILLTFTVLPILTVYPIMHRLVANISFENLLVTELWLSFMYASYNGAAVVALTEVMPVHVRTVGFSLANDPG